MDRSDRQRQMWEAMESCRAGSDDLDDPRFAELAARLAVDAELAEQFERMQRTDAQIRAAFRDVPVPVGLAERMAQRLKESKPETRLQEAVAAAVEATETAADIASDAPMPLTQLPKRFSRRRLFLGAASLSAAAVLFTAVWMHLGGGRHDTPASVLEETMQFFATDNAPQGELASQVAPPAHFPMSRDLLPMRDVHWRHVPRFLGGPAVAYDLPSMEGSRATLYVAVKRVPGLPTVPPSNPDWGTGGNSAAAWQQGDTLYVLVVEGGTGAYQNYLDQSHGPLT